MQKTRRLAALVAGGLLVVPLPGEGRKVGALMDLAHAPAFCLLASAILGVIRSWLPRSPSRSILLTWALVASLGGTAELLQGPIGRQPSWHDALANALGAAAFLIWASTPTAAPRRVGIARFATAAILLAVPSVPPALVLADAAMQAWEEPRLASFEHPLELSRWEFEECHATRSRDHATDGRWSLRLDMGRGTYPGAMLAWPFHDWSKYQYLEFDAYLGPGPPLDLVVKIEDRRHNRRPDDRFHQVVRLLPGSHRTRIALSEVEHAPRGRLLDLRQVRRLQFFTVHPPGPRTVYLDEIRLR